VRIARDFHFAAFGLPLPPCEAPPPDVLAATVDKCVRASASSAAPPLTFRAGSKLILTASPLKNLQCGPPFFLTLPLPPRRWIQRPRAKPLHQHLLLRPLKRPSPER